MAQQGRQLMAATNLKKPPRNTGRPTILAEPRRRLRITGINFRKTSSSLHSRFDSFGRCRFVLWQRPCDDAFVACFSCSLLPIKRLHELAHHPKQRPCDSAQLHPQARHLLPNTAAASVTLSYRWWVRCTVHQLVAQRVVMSSGACDFVRACE